MNRAVSAALLFASFIVGPVAAMPPLPRKSPEFTITLGPNKETLLSSYRGKVVVLAFVHTTCVHCQAFSGLLMKLERELGPKGFQPIDVAWNQNASVLAPGFVKQLGLDFPVGYSDWDPIMSYLGFSVMDRPVVPLVVVIDRKGMIRAQSPPSGDPNLQDEAKLKALLASLLAEKK
jgi:thiol-disulfide isomerase/thioredoxin